MSWESGGVVFRPWAQPGLVPNRDTHLFMRSHRGLVLCGSSSGTGATGSRLVKGHRMKQQPARWKKTAMQTHKLTPSLIQSSFYYKKSVESQIRTRAKSWKKISRAHIIKYIAILYPLWTPVQGCWSCQKQTLFHICYDGIMGGSFGLVEHLSRVSK